MKLQQWQCLKSFYHEVYWSLWYLFSMYAVLNSISFTNFIYKWISLHDLYDYDNSDFFSNLQKLQSKLNDFAMHKVSLQNQMVKACFN